jgi:hypothetical protein
MTDIVSFKPTVGQTDYPNKVASLIDYLATILGANDTLSNVRATLGLGTSNSPTFAGLIATALMDLSGAAAGNIKFPATQNPSANANTFDDYAETSYTGTLTGCTTSPTTTIYVTKFGNACVLDVIGDLNGTSNATTKTVTGMGTATRPATAKNGHAVPIQNNGGAYAFGKVNLGTNGVLSYVINADDAVWTASGACILFRTFFPYTIN